MKKLRFQLGAILLFGIFGALFLFIFLRIVTMQVTGETEGHQLAVEAAKKYEYSNILKAQRGKILDSGGNIIAEDIENYKLIAVVRESVTKNVNYPEHVVDKKKTARMLAKYIDLTEEEIFRILNPEKDLYQVEFNPAGNDIDYKTMVAIKNEIVVNKKTIYPGLHFETTSKRYYPNGAFASFAIGYTQREINKEKKEEVIGRMGIESKFNKILTGENGTISYDKDSRGYLLPSSKETITPAKDGKSIYLTLDKTIQSYLDDALSNVQERYNPESVVAIVADPKTGAIKAMSQTPDFVPSEKVSVANWLNLGVEDVIEPGSTMKTFTLAAAVDSNNWHPNATYQSGQYKLADRTIRDHNQVGWGTISYLEGFQRSSNTAMAYMLNIMGPETFEDYIDRFGFGSKTGIELPRESSGTILMEKPINRLTTAYGQGSTVTPIQLIQGVTAIANEGKMMQPYLVEKIVDPTTNKVVEKHEPTVKGTPVSKETAQTVKEILASTVTSENGTAQAFKLDAYSVAGKTGTAQVARKDGLGYDWGTNSYLYSFLGMAPVENPQLVMYIAVKKPKLSATDAGSAPASQIFKNVMDRSLKYLNVTPSKTIKTELVEMADEKGQPVADVVTSLASQGVRVVQIGDGMEVLEQYPRAGSVVEKGTTVFIKADGAITMPDLKDWSYRNVLTYKSMSGLKIDLTGEGFVTTQSVTAGTIVDEASPIVVHLKTPKEIINTSVEEATEEALPQD